MSEKGDLRLAQTLTIVIGTIVTLMGLNPLHRAFGGVQKIIASSYQAVSGTGAKAIEELRRQVNDAALTSSGESIMHAIRAVTPVWKILAWTLITTIVLSTLAVLLMAIAAIISAGPIDDR